MPVSPWNRHIQPTFVCTDNLESSPDSVFADHSTMTDAQPETPGVTQVVHLTEGGAKNVVDSYSRFYTSFSEEKKREREENSRQITESFYELVTDFYEYGYGQSFHFGPLYEGLSNDECLVRYEREIARDLNVKPGDRVLVSPCCARVIVRLHDFLHCT